MNRIKKVGRDIKKFFISNLSWLVVAGTALLCILFLIFGKTAVDGSITLDGSNAKIEESTTKFIEDSQAALDRIMNVDKPTDEQVEKENEVDEVGLGFYTTIEDVLARRLPDGNNDGGLGWQCSKYTAYLGTGKREYSTAHPDYGPVNGKDVAAYLVQYYGFKYIDQPVAGAIGSGGFNTAYGHTVMYLYSTGTNTAMVNDANWTPLTVSTHNMNISGWVWVVPGSYNPQPEPTPTPSPEPSPAPSPVSGDTSYVVKRSDTLGDIILRQGYTGKLFGDDGAAQRVATYNKIPNRGLIYPGQTIIIRKEDL